MVELTQIVDSLERFFRKESRPHPDKVALWGKTLSGYKTSHPMVNPLVFQDIFNSLQLVLSTRLQTPKEELACFNLICLCRGVLTLLKFKPATL